MALLTVHDLEHLPDDGNRYELIDGELYVDGALATRRQVIISWLHARLDAVCLPQMEVLAGRYQSRLRLNTEEQPDLLVAAYDDFTEENPPGPPSLAVDVFSPSSSVGELNRKKRLYGRFGVPSYWVIDPLEPSLIAFELDDSGRYQTIAEVKGDKPFEATEPFPVSVVLTDLLGGFAKR